MHEPFLQHWLHGLTHFIRSSLPDLTNRQLALLIHVEVHSGPQTVRGLAKQLNVSKAVITRALDRLAGLGYVLRQADPSDGRNVHILGTVEGTRFLEQFAGCFHDGASPIANGNAG